MSDETKDNETGSQAKPTITIAEKDTITIAEKEGGATSSDAKPTITIAEKDGGK
jgi:hypothetical protein